jgi:hypothetical protein
VSPSSILVESIEIGVDLFDDIADALASLLDEDDASVVEFFAFNQCQEVIIEGHEEPVVVAGILQLLAVRIA